MKRCYVEYLLTANMTHHAGVWVKASSSFAEIVDSLKNNEFVLVYPIIQEDIEKELAEINPRFVLRKIEDLL